MGKFGYTKKGQATVEALREIKTAGTPESLQPAIVATTIALVTGAPATITDSDSKFLLKGFKAGDVIDLSGSAADDGQYTIDTIVAGTLTLITGDTLVGEVAGTSLTITKKGRVFCREIIMQVPEANTSTKLAVSRSSSLDLSTGQGIVLAKLNTLTYEGVYLDEVYVDVGTNADTIFYEHTPVLSPNN